ncbi:MULTISPECIES: hypothetical protein [unclassified Fibrobacter]|uniref:hypothetical protein n=1 Tax=unclassified Fibrobacter TaxID=2634177 RepID=UPI000D78F066|nr:MULTISPECIES: hypothetical protein [unclassified Fibrobacter]PWJ68372.1 hypothetical protein BGX12_10898 [Fibrobacter sp. UWR4]PZW68094.1 hypothetical protein C8E88_10201 [Fibrobacter sp. UWR1]
MKYMTNHATERLAQRCIDERLVLLCQKYGKRVRTNHGRYLLRREDVPHYELIGATAAFKSHVEKQLPICCVFSETDVCITAFRVTDRINKSC